MKTGGDRLLTPAQREQATAVGLRRALRQAATPATAKVLQGFFKTGPGEYGEGDVFLGVKVPEIRKLVRMSDGVPRREVEGLVKSRFHEERLLGWLVLVRRFERGDEKTREGVFQFYLGHTAHVNNWDLVDVTAPNIVGAWLLNRPRGVLDSLAGSASLWERRIAVVSTLALIRKGQFDDTERVCERLLGDRHDLMHKACGWMLREVGKRDRAVLEAFLGRHATVMPRTMLRYAIERLPERERKGWMRR